MVLCNSLPMYTHKGSIFKLFFFVVKLIFCRHGASCAFQLSVSFHLQPELMDVLLCV